MTLTALPLNNGYYRPTASDLNTIIDVVNAVQTVAVNVTAYGADPTGVSRSTVAIQGAINALGATGGTVTGPIGTYLLHQVGSISHDSMSPDYCLIINGPSTADANGAHGPITLDFPAGTVFKLDADQPDTSLPILINGSGTNRRLNRTVIRGIIFDGNWANQSGGTNWTDNGLITAIYANDILVEECEFKNAPLLGMQIMRDSRGVVIRHNRFDGTHAQTEGSGTSLRIETQDVTVDSNVFITDALAGRTHLALSCNADIDAQGRHMRVTNNLFAGGYSGNALDIAGASHCLIQGNMFRDVCDTAGYAIGLSVYSNANGTVFEPSWNVITDNIFMNCRQGILLGVGSGTINSTKWTLGAYGNVIANNIFTQDVDGGIRTSLGGANAYPDRFTPAPNGAAVNFVNGIKSGGSALLAAQPTTSATATTVVNSAGTMGTTAYVNTIVTIVSGTGKGQSRAITSHTGTALTVPTWDVTPDTTSTWVIHAPMGNNRISGNKFWMTNNTAKAIDLTTAFQVDQVIDNESFGTVAATPFVYGSNTVYRGNKGWSSKPPFKSGEGMHITWQDENSGTASVLTGTTEISVTHKLGRTPTIDQIMVWPTSDNGSATTWWVPAADITSTVFKIKVDVDPAGTYSFGWRVFGAT